MDEVSCETLKEKCQFYIRELEKLKNKSQKQSFSKRELILRQIASLQSENFTSIIELYENKPVSSVLLEHDAILHNEQLIETEEILEKELQGLEKEISKQKKKREINKKIKEGLISNLENFDEEKFKEEDRAQKLDKKEKLEMLLNNLESSLNDFLDTYYPELQTRDIKRMKSNRTDYYHNQCNKFTPLCDFLNELLDFDESQPRNYMKIPDSIWEPHLELLLRSGVAEMNSENRNFIRIVDFKNELN